MWLSVLFAVSPPFLMCVPRVYSLKRRHEARLHVAEFFFILRVCGLFQQRGYVYVSLPNALRLGRKTSPILTTLPRSCVYVTRYVRGCLQLLQHIPHERMRINRVTIYLRFDYCRESRAIIREHAGHCSR